MLKYDVIIAGSGIAALQLARRLQDQLNVMIITKNHVTDSNSYLAQGGIAAPVGKKDTVDLHVKDTIIAGCFHQSPETVENVIRDGKRIIECLINEGAPFDRRSEGNLALGIEGAHSQPRILHSGGDQTGKYLIEYFLASLTEKVRLVQGEMVYELIRNERGRCCGVKTKKGDGSIASYAAHHVVLATGGAGSLYSVSSNAPEVTGDGMALAFLAGAELTDMEFIQFHPTLLSLGGKTGGLISEAVRGEGAILINDAGDRIMEGIHPQMELAPRHIVAERMNKEILEGRKVFLDINPVKDFESKFPSITNMCKHHGISLTQGKIPVTPGCHFTMGGIVTDEDGKTTVEGLYAIGEAACTGLHGANRLASNSLLEGLVFGERLARHLTSAERTENSWTTSYRNPEQRQHRPEITFTRQELKERMMRDAGIIRNRVDLSSHLEWLKAQAFTFEEELDHMYREEIQLYLMWVVSMLITQSALLRTESRGGHIRSDYPIENNEDWFKRSLFLQNENHQLKVVQDEQHQIKIYA
ncbi:L-aspartate oxidase [Rossellomorea aquimaris]|uniref:L-aspartate oxidase n=1 Tax=Rossellomorea aquimaris TaxID=189382 RepID=A0A1J6WFQ5_9BACI|nr:L-aspartate oxidase [Rossellomorea aquimaris]OIU70712.1 L-aspartate oxidase [Rossellomorea aquimaris]